jgi:DNA-damage-inducible protein D
MNGDPSKPEIAAAKAYFVVRVRQAEVAEERAVTVAVQPGQLTGAALILAMAQQFVEQERSITEARSLAHTALDATAKLEARMDEAEAETKDWPTALGT